MIVGAQEKSVVIVGAQEKSVVIVGALEKSVVTDAHLCNNNCSYDF